MIKERFSVKNIKDPRTPIAVFFPGWYVTSQMSPFENRRDVVLISQGRYNDEAFPGKEVILVCQHAPITLDTKEGAWEILSGRGVKIPKDIPEMEDEEFWRFVKLAIVHKKWLFEEGGEGKSVFFLFKSLFSSFEENYKVYRSIGTSHRVIFSSLLTMMMKTQEENLLKVSPGYRVALETNKSSYPLFKKAVLEYLQTPMGEMDFLTLLLSVSRGG